MIVDADIVKSSSTVIEDEGLCLKKISNKKDLVEELSCNSFERDYS